MLYIHQSGNVKIGEVVRYTVTYTPSKDSTFPAPEKFYVRIRNTSAAALRAAVIAGPFTLSVCAYPATFDPFEKLQDPGSYGVPQFEPMVKAGAKWDCELLVPSKMRQAAARATRYDDLPDEIEPATVSWVIEVSSQIIFTTAAAVGYHVMVASDHRSLKSLLGTSALAQGNPVGKLRAHREYMRSTLRPSTQSTAGLFSKSMSLKVEDTEMLWNSPSLLDIDTGDSQEDSLGVEGSASAPRQTERTSPREKPKRKKVHLVIITHGLLSAMGSDMLFLKEQIDASAKRAKADARARKTREPAGCGDDDDDDDDEEVIVRGYSGNATKTQKGIRFLGKRVAKYVLSMTYPDQPYLPSGETIDDGFAQGIAGDHHRHHHGEHPFMPHEYLDVHRRSYKVTSISFIGHSLGGPTQTFAIAYIQKHCPDFFDIIKPRNFITLASPMLGVSNENPFYVRFALDSGLVGKSGRDLGLSWGTKTVLRSGIGAFVAGTRAEPVKESYGDVRPESKPLMQILPTGPAHTALKKFENRTVYANIVNDGIVPLRTSSLLFLDWQSIEKVERTRRDAGFIEMIAAIGWYEMTGTNLITNSQRAYNPSSKSSSNENVSERDDATAVPQPSEAAMTETDGLARLDTVTAAGAAAGAPTRAGYTANAPLAGFFKKFKESSKEFKESKDERYVSHRHKLMLSRGQTFHGDELPSAGVRPGLPEGQDGNALRSKTLPLASEIPAPPSTTLFEGFGDVLNPAVADVEHVINPELRPKTIYHDRTYQPGDIPHMQRQSAMRVEEKIARSYHRDMSWRKVLVRLEPDAHNNIIVRRMFVNSHGWPVIMHLVDAHFSSAAMNPVQEVEEIQDSSEPQFDMLRGKSMRAVSMPPAYDPIGLPTPDDEERTARQLEALRMLEEPMSQVTSSNSFEQSQMDLDDLAWHRFNWSGSEYSDDEEAKASPKMKSVVEALQKQTRQEKAQTWFGGRAVDART
ncbi:hypothetical protein HIM_06057 [Hirsutella minnesotensis 3608]|uniref:DUF676 domain-containing protein n=1 Tax=Hirsutella minnesotensis 3608 TaxID=1043627 RepID=A0A0F7ZJJ0_9HYPO|nr:hypothetical protein HIM_06057 [Hirsutella minnesotensis 3608]